MKKQKIVRMNKNAKLNIVKTLMNLPAEPGLKETKFLNVISEAKDAINVPVPPMLTPISKDL